MATKGPNSDAGATKPARKPAAPRARKVPTAAPAAEGLALSPAPVVAETPVPPVLAAPAPAEPIAAAPVLEAPVVTAPVADAAPLNPTPPAAQPSVHAPKKELTMENTVHAATEKTQAMFAEMNERTKASMEKTTKMFADMNEFSKGNIDAMMESSKIAVKGIETMGQDVAEFTRKSFEAATATMRNMAAVKSPAELMKLQSEYVRQSFDSVVAEASKNAEAMLKLAGDVAQPLSNRVALAAEKVKASA